MFGTAGNSQEALDHVNALATKMITMIDGDDPDAAFDLAMDLAKARGAEEMFAKIERAEANMTQRCIPRPLLRFELMRMVATSLSRGADDHWSGRGNDRARAKFDGRCEAAETIIDRLSAEQDAELNSE